MVTFNANPGAWNAGTPSFAGSTNKTLLLNTSTGTDGFGGQFTGNFVRVGSRANQLIGAASNNTAPTFAQTSFAFGGNSNMLSLGTSGREFVSLTFDYIFNGQESTPGSHNWQVQLIRYLSDGSFDSTFSPISLTPMITGLSPTLSSFSTNEVFVAALMGGERYGFRVTLDEPGTLSASNNTALGFNNVVVRAAVPYELETGIGLGAVGLLFL
ncbi:MAG: hypothetical protein ACUVSQ_02980 [Pseudanabaenaceae cyanobacterium]